ncbi:MAG: hypothetical protein EBT15_11630 [Betaproteobacteria bacterium]|nr:hypothetical protein [Betaproteobacteria bacterium]
MIIWLLLVAVVVAEILAVAVAQVVIEQLQDSLLLHQLHIQLLLVLADQEQQEELQQMVLHLYFLL